MMVLLLMYTLELASRSFMHDGDYEERKPAHAHAHHKTPWMHGKLTTIRALLCILFGFLSLPLPLSFLHEYPIWKKFHSNHLYVHYHFDKYICGGTYSIEYYEFKFFINVRTNEQMATNAMNAFKMIRYINDWKQNLCNIVALLLSCFSFEIKIYAQIFEWSKWNGDCVCEREWTNKNQIIRL